MSFSVGTGVVFSRIQCRKFLECMSFFLGFSVGNFWNECRFLLDSVSEIFGQAAFFYVISTSDKELLLSLSIVAVKNVISLLSASGLTR